MKIRQITFILCLIAGQALAGETGAPDVLFGFKAGYLGSGTVHVAGTPFDTDSSHSYGAFLDYRVAPKLYMGMHLFIHNMSAFGVSKNLMDIGGAFKAVIPTRNDRLTVRPCLNMGYGSLPEIPLGVITVESSSYFLIGPSLEFLYATQSAANLIGEIGFLSAPTGGNAQATVTLTPTVFLRAGVAF